MKKLFVFVTVLGLLLPNFAFAADDGVPRITKEELKTKMDKGQDIILLDVRTGRSYDGSNVKIKGAMRISPDEVETRYKELAKDKEIVTYCT
ncbi:MAG TPA: rhodanese-like domain-containing protein [Thermodesulfobacteriota bacterium]|nr:rhodanese-like domain-containing protein [Thermodesulfobacteriota bacterium]